MQFQWKGYILIMMMICIIGVTVTVRTHDISGMDAQSLRCLAGGGLCLCWCLWLLMLYQVPLLLPTMHTFDLMVAQAARPAARNQQQAQHIVISTSYAVVSK